MTKRFLIIVCFLTIAFPALIFAEENPVVGDEGQNQVPAGIRKDINKINRDAGKEVKGARQDANKEVKNILRDAQSNMKNARQEGIKEIKALRATTTEAIKKNRREMTDKIKMATTTKDRRELKIELRKDFQADRTQKREEIKTIVEEKRNVLKEKLKVVKDQRKQQVVERIDERINSVNEIRTDHFLKLLEKFEDFLDRISARADVLEKEGKDVTGVRTAIASAESAIATSRAAIETQAGKIYEIIITTEGNLGNDVSASVRARQSDLRAIRETVKKAHGAVRKALSALKLIGVSSGGGTATTTTATTTSGE